MLRIHGLALVALTLPSFCDGAAVIEIDSEQVGGYFDTGAMNIDPTFQNYFVGHSTTITPGPLDPDPRSERRSFFIFDLSTVSDTIDSATLTLHLPLAGVVADEPMETFLISSVLDPTTMIPVGASFMVDAGKTTTDAMAIFDELGKDTPATAYGSIDIAEADEGTGSFDDATVITIDLSPTALADINSLAGTSEMLVIGGRLASHSFGPDDLGAIPPIFEKSELLFAHTNVDAPMPAIPPSVPKPMLTLVSVPEPNRFILVAFCSLLNFSWQWTIRKGTVVDDEA